MTETDRNAPNEPNFAVGRKAPRRHRGHGDVSKCNFNKELDLMLCGLRVSVVKNRGSVRQTNPNLGGRRAIGDWGLGIRLREGVGCQTNPICPGPGGAEKSGRSPWSRDRTQARQTNPIPPGGNAPRRWREGDDACKCYYNKELGLMPRCHCTSEANDEGGEMCLRFPGG